jgi:hypothetical protein
MTITAFAGNVYPGAFPTVNGDKITVEQWVKNPTMLRRVLESMVSQRFIGDFIFGSGDAQGGAVIYDQLTAQDLYPNEGDVGDIAPGGEFPSADTSDPTPKVAAVRKRGLQTKVTYDTVRRNDRDVLQRKLIKLSNAMTRRLDLVTFNVLDNEPLIPTSAAAKPLTDATADPINDFFQSIKVVDEADLGYKVDTCIVNPQEAYRLLGRKDIRDALPRENTAINPLLSRRLAGLFEIPNWIISNRQTAGKARLLQAKVAGSMRDEVPFYSRTIDWPLTEVYFIQVARQSVPIITDPKSIVNLTGL